MPNRKQSSEVAFGRDLHFSGSLFLLFLHHVLNGDSLELWVSLISIFLVWRYALSYELCQVEYFDERKQKSKAQQFHVLYSVEFIYHSQCVRIEMQINFPTKAGLQGRRNQMNSLLIFCSIILLMVIGRELQRNI